MSIVPASQLDEIDYESFPTDSDPQIRWPAPIETKLTFNTFIWVLSTVALALLIALLVQLRWSWSDDAALAAFFFGTTLTFVISELSKKKYLAHISSAPEIQSKSFLKCGANHVWLANERTLKLGKYAKAVTVAFILLGACVCLFFMDGTISKIDIYQSMSSYLAILLLFVLVALIVCCRELKTPRQRKLSVLLLPALFNCWFAADPHPKIPYGLPPRAGSRIFRVFLFYVAIQFLALSLPWLVYYSPLVPICMSDKTESDLILCHPVKHDEELQDIEPIGLKGPHTVDEMVTRKLPEEFYTDEMIEPIYLASTQRIYLRGEPNGWLKAMSGFFGFYPLTGAAALATSFLLCFLLVSTVFLSSFYWFVADTEYVSQISGVSEAVNEGSKCESISKSLSKSTDKYERESLFVGEIIQ